VTSENAQREIAHLARHAMDTRLDPVERAGSLLIAHQRRDAGSCLCGWDEVGKSHAAHQADELARTGLLAAADHRARLAAAADGFHDAVCTGPGVPAGFTCTDPSHARLAAGTEEDG
jgi:hypothetical protein